MCRVVKAVYRDGVLKPLEELDLEEGEEIVLEIKRRARGKGLRRFFGVIGRVWLEDLEEEYHEYIEERASIPRQQRHNELL